MDFKKLGMFVRMLGLIIFGYGAFQFASHLDKKFEPPKQQANNAFSALIEQSNANIARMVVDEENVRRKDIRSTATMIMVGGGVVFFIGFAIAASAKKPNMNAVED